MGKKIILLICACMVSACSGTSIGGRELNFACAGGQKMALKVGLLGHAELYTGKQTLRLKKTDSASGERWSDGNTTLWVKGRQAYVEQGGRPLYFGCTGV